MIICDFLVVVFLPVQVFIGAVGEMSFFVCSFLVKWEIFAVGGALHCDVIGPAGAWCQRTPHR